MRSDNSRLGSDAPLITIGVTCFDAASTIRRVVLSAVLQDWPNTEIIVVDDCSTDNSWQILGGGVYAFLACISSPVFLWQRLGQDSTWKLGSWR